MSPTVPEKACYNCMKRRIICDKSLPTCKKCAKKNLICPGYGIRYRFASSHTIADLAPPSTGPSPSPSAIFVDAAEIEAREQAKEATEKTSSKVLTGIGFTSNLFDTPQVSSGCIFHIPPSYPPSPFTNPAGITKPQRSLPLKWVDSITASSSSTSSPSAPPLATSTRRRPRHRKLLARFTSTKFHVPLLDAAVETVAPSNANTAYEQSASPEDTSSVVSVASAASEVSAGSGVSYLSETEAALGYVNRLRETSPLVDPWRPARAVIPEINLTFTLPPLLASHNNQVRFLFDHFVNYVSPVMVMYDDSANGYRYQIMPLAVHDPVVQRAVCVVAAFHLSAAKPELRGPAEKGRDAIIRKLRENSLQNPQLDEYSWAILLLLLVGDLVTGHEHVLVLSNMLDSFLAQRQHDPRGSALSQFLFYQSRLITFFTLPILDESRAIQAFTKVAFAPLTTLEQFAPRPPGKSWPVNAIISPTPATNSADSHIQTLENIFRTSFATYVLRAAAARGLPGVSTGDRAAELHGNIKRLRALCGELDLAKPGSHTVVWPLFIAAAEAEEEDREFFVGILRSIGEATGYWNVFCGVEALPMLWADRERWTANLRRVGTVIM